jgi:cell division septum initiation protein DivIVA
MDNILAAATKLQEQYKQLKYHNKKLEHELAEKAKRQKAMD